MLVLITYDVNTTIAAGRKRLRQVSKYCVAHGQRVQNSVFECNINEAQFVALREVLCGMIDKETDSLRFYNLGNRFQGRIQHVGAKETYDPEGVLML